MALIVYGWLMVAIWICVLAIFGEKIFPKPFERYALLAVLWVSATAFGITTYFATGDWFFLIPASLSAIWAYLDGRLAWRVRKAK